MQKYDFSKYANEFKQLKKESRQYKNLSEHSIDKVWNRGMGCLDFITYDAFENVLLVNSCLLTKRDKERIERIFPKDLPKKLVAFGYPLYYNHSLIWVHDHLKSHVTDWN